MIVLFLLLTKDGGGIYRSGSTPIASVDYFFIIYMDSSN